MKAKTYCIKIEFTNGEFTFTNMTADKDYILKYFKKGKRFLHEGFLHTVKKVEFVEI